MSLTGWIPSPEAPRRKAFVVVLHFPKYAEPVEIRVEDVATPEEAVEYIKRCGYRIDLLEHEAREA